MILNRIEFVRRFKRVMDVYGSDKFPEAFLDYAEQRTRDLKDTEMDKLCELLVANLKHRPSVADIVAYASTVRLQRTHFKNPYQDKDGELCASCGDLGVFRAIGENHDLLVNCDDPHRNLNKWCKASYYWPLPKLNNEIKKRFKISKPPVEWFKPELSQSRYSKMPEWREKIKISEAIWKDLGLL